MCPKYVHVYGLKSVNLNVQYDNRYDYMGLGQEVIIDGELFSF